MKSTYTQLLLLLVFLVSSCSTGMYMSGAYTDDLYFIPADQPVVIEIRVLVEKTVIKEDLDIQEHALKNAEEDFAEGEREYVLVDSLYEEFVDDEGNTIVNNHG